MASALSGEVHMMCVTKGREQLLPEPSGLLADAG